MFLVENEFPSICVKEPHSLFEYEYLPQRWNRSSFFHTGNSTGGVSQIGPDRPVDRYS